MVIRFFASLRNITGVKEVSWDDATPSLGDLLRQLGERYGPEFRHWVLEGEELGGGVLVIVNGDDVRHREGLKTRLASSDVISLLPIMAGGQDQCGLRIVECGMTRTVIARETDCTVLVKRAD